MFSTACRHFLVRTLVIQIETSAFDVTTKVVKIDAIANHDDDEAVKYNENLKENTTLRRKAKRR